MLLVAGTLVTIAKLHDRHEPVPVQHRHVVVDVGRGVPAQQVIVIDADFTGLVVMADVVVIGLGQRHMNEAENQETDSQFARPAPQFTPLRHHVLPRSRSSTAPRLPRIMIGRTEATESHALWNIMNQQQEVVKRRGYGAARRTPMTIPFPAKWPPTN